MTAERKQLAPGVWAIGDAIHIDEEQFIRAAGGNPHSPADRARAERVIARICAEKGITYQEVEPA